MNDDKDNLFEQGYHRCLEKSLCDSAIAGINVIGSTEYVRNIKKAIKDLSDNINSCSKTNCNNKGIHGNIAEIWHEGTFNIDAAIKDRSDRAVRLNSNKKASVDIQVVKDGNIEDDFSLKYCGPSKSKYKDAKGGPESAYAQYSPQENGVSKFYGQKRVVPKGGAETGKKFLENEYGDKAQETIANITESVTSKDGKVSSKSLSYEDSVRIKDDVVDGKGGFQPENYNLSDVKYEYILKKSCKIGLRSAITASAISVLPQVVQILVNEGYSFDDFKNLCETGAESSIEAFLQGSISANLSICCQLGKFGEALKNINPTMTAYAAGAITAITIHTMKNAYLVAMGRKQSRELANDLLSYIFISAGGMIGGALVSFIPIPFMGYFLGSAIGSILASFVYKNSYSAIIGLCKEHGYTLWGLVRQDYTVPAEILEEIGFDVIKLDKIKLDKIELDKIEIDRTYLDTIQPKALNIRFLSRGVIGINEIGYVF